MTALSEFFLNSSPVVVYLELLEISHPNFSQTYYLTREPKPLTVTHSLDGSHDYTFCPMTIKPLGADQDLDQDIEITLGDVGEVIAKEIENVYVANAMMVKPIAKYRVYRSDDLTDELFGPEALRIDAVSLTKEGAAFRAKSASFNIVRTGESYRTERFPMLEAL